MNKTVLLRALVVVTMLTTGCNNFFHEILPPDGNLITSFSIPGQIGPARIGDNSISVTVGPDTAIDGLIPSISVSSKATLIPVTLPYIQKAFPSADLLREGIAFYTSGDQAAYAIDLIKRTPDFSVPALDTGIDFSTPVYFLVISGLGNIRQYTVNVEGSIVIPPEPPDENRIVSFSVSGQIGPALIGGHTIDLTVGPGADIRSLLPTIFTSPNATLIPVTLPYIQRAFPSINLFQEGIGFYTSSDQAGYLAELIKQNPDFNIPALDTAIDFSEPVTILVISALGNIRQYTVSVEVDSAEGKFRSFAFTKFDNADLSRGDATVTVNNDAKTIAATVWYPVENIASFTLIPRFETNGATVSCEGTELTSGETGIYFDKPASAGWNTVSGTKTLLVTRPGFEPSSYTLTVTFKEDPDTARSITDFRFNESLNYGIRYTAMGEITESGDTGSIRVSVHHSGSIPTSLVPSFVSPGKVSVGGAPQTSGTQLHDFTGPVDYTVVSRDNMYTRTYRVMVDFVNDDDARPRIQGFAFTTADNGGLSADTSALINHEAGLIVIEAVYDIEPPPYFLIPRFSAGGNVSVGGKVQSSGVDSQDFSRRVKYTVKNPGNPFLYRDYWVETRFVKESTSLAEISTFGFSAADNPGLVADVQATIDQAAGTINAVLLFDSVNEGHRSLRPQWLAQGTVQVGGVIQTSGVSGVVIGPQTVYRVVSANGVFYRDYTVRVLEVNTRIYVDRDAGGDNTGVSWANAFRNLMDACEAAEKLPAALPAEIWIAEGSYRPSETGDTTAYFKIRGNTGYYGGFAGYETSKDQRVPGAHTVTITGELGGEVLSEHLFMNPDLGNMNASFDGLTFTKARA
ncbi:MAG: hypothetical protein LBU21_06245, partial [Treponema sp.]|nr:hypothetical protein [Treponema sp.]